MKAYEFKAVLDSAGTILVPENIKNKLSNNIKVIILDEETTKTNTLLTRLKKILSDYSNLKSFAGVDPVKWQKKTRSEW